MNNDDVITQQLKDRKELNDLPSGTNKPMSWCNEHDCKMGTCFKLHYPDSFGDDAGFERESVKENWKELWNHRGVEE